jgi:hypothetical protein
VRERREREAQTLADLTGWNLREIRRKAGLQDGKPPEPQTRPWWRRIFD